MNASFTVVATAPVGELASAELALLTKHVHEVAPGWSDRDAQFYDLRSEADGKVARYLAHSPDTIVVGDIVKVESDWDIVFRTYHESGAGFDRHASVRVVDRIVESG